MSPVEYRTHFSLSKNLFFDKLAEGKEATKTSNSTPKCMRILERVELRSKSKCLAKQGTFHLSGCVDPSTLASPPLGMTLFCDMSHFDGWWVL